MPYEMKDGKKVKIGEYGPNTMTPSGAKTIKNSIREKNMKRQSKKGSHNPY